MTRFISDNQQELDAEWVELMLSARSKGLTTEEVSKVLRILQEQGQSNIKENAV
ncbi:anti-repressor SinI family protein [Paenibacillus sp. strain BS8-2]